MDRLAHRSRIWETANGRVIRSITLPHPAHRVVSLTVSRIVVRTDDGYLLVIGGPGVSRSSR